MILVSVDSESERDGFLIAYKDKLKGVSGTLLVTALEEVDLMGFVDRVGEFLEL